MTPDLSSIAATLDHLSKDMAEVRTSVKELASAVTRLALVEERQSNANEALARAFKELDRHDRRLNTIEQAQPLQKQSAHIVQSAVALILSAALGAAIASIFIAPNGNRITLSAPKVS